MNNEFLNNLSLSDIDCLFRMYKEKYDQLSQVNFNSFEESEHLIEERNKICEEMKIIEIVRNEKFNMVRNMAFGSINAKAFK